MYKTMLLLVKPKKVNPLLCHQILRIPLLLVLTIQEHLHCWQGTLCSACTSGPCDILDYPIFAVLGLDSSSFSFLSPFLFLCHLLIPPFLISSFFSSSQLICVT